MLTMLQSSRVPVRVTWTPVLLLYHHSRVLTSKILPSLNPSMWLALGKAVAYKQSNTLSIRISQAVAKVRGFAHPGGCGP